MRTYLSRIEAAIVTQLNEDLYVIDPTLTEREHAARVCDMLNDMSAADAAAMAIDLGVV